MLNPIKPPTDNLYKFIAIAGMIGVALGTVLVTRQIGSTLDAWIPAADAMYEASLAAHGYEPAQDLLNTYWKRTVEGETPFGLSVEARQLPRLDPDLLAAVRRFEIAGGGLAREIGVQNLARVYLISLIGISLAATVLGFFYWYRRTQRCLDALLCQQAEAQQQSQPAAPKRALGPHGFGRGRKIRHVPR